MPAIECKNLTKKYGKARGIQNVNLTVEEGEFFGFIGPNGAGKSTTIRTLLGLLRPSSGFASLDGQDCWKNKPETLKNVGYLPSESSFYPGMKVKNVCRLSAKLRNEDCEDEMIELAQRLQLDLNKKVNQLSFGNKKKVAIVCALQHDPDILILDEPTSGLDPLMQKEFFEIIKERHERGCTIFMSSHILKEVQNYCQRAAIIKNGQIIACDTVENLKQTNVKKVIIKGNVDVSALKGIRNLERNLNTTSFYYDGPMDSLLRTLMMGTIQDLVVEDLDLEEIFMHYYEEETL